MTEKWVSPHDQVVKRLGEALASALTQPCNVEVMRNLANAQAVYNAWWALEQDRLRMIRHNQGGGDD
jgi:hypothetical protein